MANSPKVRTPEKELDFRVLAICKYTDAEKNLKRYRKYIRENEEKIADPEYLFQTQDCQNSIERYQGYMKEINLAISKLLVQYPFLEPVYKITHNEFVQITRKPLQG